MSESSYEIRERVLKAEGYKTHWGVFIILLREHNIRLARMLAAQKFIEGTESVDLQDFDCCALDKHSVQIDKIVVEAKELDVFGHIYYMYRIREV